VKLIWLALVLTRLYSAACAPTMTHDVNAATSSNRNVMEFSGRRVVEGLG
jgi:hypothetical protein